MSRPINRARSSSHRGKYLLALVSAATLTVLAAPMPASAATYRYWAGDLASNVAKTNGPRTVTGGSLTNVSTIQATFYIQTASSPSAAPAYSADTTTGSVAHSHPGYVGGYGRCFWHPNGIANSPQDTRCFVNY